MFRKRTAIEVWGTPFLAIAEDCPVLGTRCTEDDYYVRRYEIISPKEEFNILAKRCITENRTFDIEVACIDGLKDKFYLGNGNLIQMNIHEMREEQTHIKCSCCGKEMSANDRCFWKNGGKEVFCSMKCAVKSSNYRTGDVMTYIREKAKTEHEEVRAYGYTE